MGWQTLRTSLRQWESGPPSRELKDAVEEVLAGDDQEAALRMFTDALSPSLDSGSTFLKKLAQTDGAKCRCDTVWYGDTIAYGCKTCGLSSASCICVFCFEAGDHEGHDFYISRSDYGCCDCGDAHAWRRSGFCRHHPGPRRDVDPTVLLPKETRRRAEVLIPAQVCRLVQYFQPGQASGGQTTDVEEGGAAMSIGGAVSSTSTLQPTITPLDHDVDGNAAVDGGVSQPSGAQGLNARLLGSPPFRVMLTGISLRVSEEQLKEFVADGLSRKLSADQLQEELASLRILLARDADTKASKGRAYLELQDMSSMYAMQELNNEVLRGSPVKVHAGDAAIAAAEKRIWAWEAHFEWLLALGGFHDGLRKMLGQVFLDENLFGCQSAVEVVLRNSHLMEPSVRKLETNLLVDFMLDLDFKHRFAHVFTRLYTELVLSRAGNQDTNELGDFTCQIFTRQDVTLELVREHGLIKNLLSCLWHLLEPALQPGAVPAVFRHESVVFKDHEIIQCTMDLLYVLDHPEVARAIITTPNLRDDLWTGWLRILTCMQCMHAHQRQVGYHVESVNPAWPNTLTLHTDLMSITWLILDAVETKGDLVAAQTMARQAWAVLKEWLRQMRHAEDAEIKPEDGMPAGASHADGVISYEVTRRRASFYVPLNRVLAMLLHQLCIRASQACSSQPSVWQVFADTGLLGADGSEFDVVLWMEHPLRALVMHSQASAGLWCRNGEVLENESEFYRMNYWHHLLMDADLLILRMGAMLIRPETFFRTLLMRFELPSWLSSGDPLIDSADFASSSVSRDEHALPKLQGLLLVLHHVLAPHSPLSLAFPEMVAHTTRQFLSVASKSYSQLWDPRLERPTATFTAQDQQLLEAALLRISSFSAADGASHTSAKYHLRRDQWGAVDPYFHLFGWSDQQKAEDNLLASIKAQRGSLRDFVLELFGHWPSPLDVYRESFFNFCSCRLLQALCWILLVKLAFKYLKGNGGIADGRVLTLALRLALRSLQAPLPVPAQDHQQHSMSQLQPLVLLEGSEEGPLLFALATKLQPHLLISSRTVFRVSTQAFFDASLYSGGLHESAPKESDICLLDAVERLASTSEETLCSGLAQGLRSRLLEDVENERAARFQTRPRPWFARPQASLDHDADVSGQPEGSTGAYEEDEARRAKRRKAAQERQKRMLNDLRKRQAAFISGEQGMQMLKEVDSKTAAEGVPPQHPCCVVCMSDVQGEADPRNPLGVLCYLRPALASCTPRERSPVESAVLLHQNRMPKIQNSESGGPRRPLTFSQSAPDGLVLARGCSHQMHFACWCRFRDASQAGVRLCCPYCGSLVNALLPAPDHAVGREHDMQDGTPAATRWDVREALQHPEASMDFSQQVVQQMQRLGDAHLIPSEVGHALEGKEAAMSSTVSPPPSSFLPISKLVADNVLLLELQLQVTSGGSSSKSASPTMAPQAAADLSPTSRASASAARASEVIGHLLREAAAAAPRNAQAHATQFVNGGAVNIAPVNSPQDVPFPPMLVRASGPHGRFQLLTVLVIAMLTGPVTETILQGLRKVLLSFYMLEAALVLMAFGSWELIDTELQRALAQGTVPPHTRALWQALHGQVREGNFFPLQTHSQAIPALHLALQPVLARVRLLLEIAASHLAGLEIDFASEPRSFAGTLSCERAGVALGFPSLEELVFPDAHRPEGTSPEDVAFQESVAAILSRWLGAFVSMVPPARPLTSLLLAVVHDSSPADGQASSLFPEVPTDRIPNYVWQLPPETLTRIVTSTQDVVELCKLSNLESSPSGRLFCIPYKLVLPVITDRVYQRFYTQFLHARCPVCGTSPSIPTLCLLCGTLLCCNSECCRKSENDSSQVLGEVTRHAQHCAFGTCFFLQLTNSLVHVVTDGYIACWGSLYLDGHGEEEYNLSRPLHISEARLQQLMQSIREVSFDFEPRLRWKRVLSV